MAHEIRDAVRGGARYYCSECGALVLKETYPEDETRGSAAANGTMHVTEYGCEHIRYAPQD